MPHSKHASKIFASLYPNAFTVGVKFGEARYDSGRKGITFIPYIDFVYTYATDYDVGIGELGIVESPYNGFVVVQIVRVDDSLDFSQFDNFVHLKWLIDSVDVTMKPNRSCVECRSCFGKYSYPHPYIRK